jgi:hypothetical protein
MTLNRSRRLAATALAALVATFPACSRDHQGELTIALAQPPSAYLFASHGIPIGWILQLALVIEERAGVGVSLQRLELTAMDRGTAQPFNFSVYERTTLEQEGLTEVGAHGQVSFRPQLGLVPIQPSGPISVIVQVFGTDREGHTVTARLTTDSSLAPVP